MENTVIQETKKKRKFWQIVGRRNVIILSVMLLIGLAVYLNYVWFYSPEDNIGYGDNNQVGAGDNSDSTPTDGVAEDYFAAVALSRENSRRESIEVLQNVVNTTEGTERENALAQIAKITETMETETNIETLVLAEGYASCVAVINGESASVVVSSENQLDPTRVANITAIVYEQSGILPVNLVIKQK